jgi:dTDP-4-amino-4,6-dideoxygalactose transaminase
MFDSAIAWTLPSPSFATMNRLALFGGNPVRRDAFPSWPIYDQQEERALLEVLHSGRWWSGTQAYHDANSVDVPSKVAAFESSFAAYCGATYGLACATGTAALEIALKAAGIGPGDEVIVPPYTFLATASAPLLVGAIPVFCDIQADTLNLDPDRLEAAITPYTRAIIPVHFAGLAADMERIMAIARKHNLFVLEDAAHAHGATSNGKYLGTLGDAGTFSFQASKNMTAGEGGLILTDDAHLAELCNSYLWAGRKLGFAWYEHFRLGWNYRLTEFQAAILSQQLTRLPQQTATRMSNGLRLNQLLKDVPGIQPLAIPSWVTQHAFHLYILRLDAQVFGVSREEFIAALEAEGIPCFGGYAHPLYRNPMFLENQFHANGAQFSPREAHIDFARYAESCPCAEQACREAVWIEHRVLLASPQAMEDVARAIHKIYECRHEFQPTLA